MSRYACPFNAPATRERVARLLDRLALSEGHRALDVGCGRGEMLAMLAERTGCIGVGVDPREDEIDRARARAASLPNLEWLAVGIEDLAANADFDAALCVGATGAFGPPGEGLSRTLETLPRFVRPGGRVLIGEGYWRQDPPGAYLEATPFEANHLATHEANEGLGERFGWRCIATEASSFEEWDAFEASFLEAAERDLAAEPSSPEARAAATHWRGWNRTYRRWGRETLGFGWYVFERGD